jgi:hypothetical protein
MQHSRTKHIEIDIHFVREKVALGEVRILHVPTSAQFVDIFTKGLANAHFNDIRFSPNVVEPQFDTAGMLDYNYALTCSASWGLLVLYPI